MNAVATSNPWLRVVLVPRETLRLGRGLRQLRVRSGQAWVTLGGRDLTLPRGESLVLDPKAGPVVVSPLGALPVVIELRQQGSTQIGTAADPREKARA